MMTINPLNSEAFERLLVWLFAKRMTWRIKRDWQEADHPPHFSYNNYGAFRLALLPENVGPYPYYRGFLSSQVIRDGDVVLDVSCGDGFFSSRFFATKAKRVDALDVESSAIEFAHRYNAAANVNFQVVDAVSGTFPSSGYDVAIWDGAIAHFEKKDTQAVIAKIKRAMKPDGIFCGSESLGFDGSEDHLQRWDTLEEVAATLKPHFRHVDLYETSFFYNLDKSGRRGEFYWRCSDSRERLDAMGWRRF